MPAIDPDDLTYFVGRETVIPDESIKSMQSWRKTIYSFLKRNSERTAAYFGVPPRQAVELGIEIEF